MSVSATTRPARPGEKDGVDYHFVDLPAFRQMVANNEFLEWAHVFDHRYGTPRAAVDQVLASGNDVLFDIDWRGAQQLYQIAGGDVVRVFILPPSMAELRPPPPPPRDRSVRRHRPAHGPRRERDRALGRL